MRRAWTLHLELDSPSKLIPDTAHVELLDDDSPLSLLGIEFDHDESSYWDVSGEERVFVKWSHYKVRASFEEPDDDRAQARAAELRARIASRWAFLTGSPVRLQRGYSIREASPPGHPYTQRVAAAEYGVGGPEWTPPVPDLDWAIHRIVAPSITPQAGQSGPFDRALLWLHASYEAASTVSEFTSLMSALEALAPLLDGSPDLYWECGTCGREFTECPECHADTGRPASANAVLRHYTTTELNWGKAEWDRVYDLRSRLLHGDKAPSGEDLLAVGLALPRIEEILLTGLKRVLGWKPADPPYPRPRAGIINPWLGLRMAPPAPPPDKPPSHPDDGKGRAE